MKIVKLTKKESKRLTKRVVVVDNICEVGVPVSVSDFIRNLQELSEKYSQYDSLCVCLNEECYDSYYVSLIGYREESDKEYGNRTGKLLLAKQKDTNHEIKLMKQLLKKYGKDS